MPPANPWRSAVGRSSELLACAAHQPAAEIKMLGP